MIEDMMGDQATGQTDGDEASTPYESEGTISIRYKTLPKNKIDADAMARLVCDEWRNLNNERDDFLARREEWSLQWRDLIGTTYRGPFDESSDFHIPLTLIYGKAVHARLWQLFSDPANFFGVRARRQDLEPKENAIKDFMHYVIEEYGNSGVGFRETWDEWLWDNVFDGSGFLKLYWVREVREYTEVVENLETTTEFTFDPGSLTGREEFTSKLVEANEDREEIFESPHLKRISLEDVGMPVGESDPQTCRFLTHAVTMADSELKARALEGKFYKDDTEDALQHRMRWRGISTDNNDQIKQTMRDIDGYNDSAGYTDDGMHVILERYGRVYVKSELDNKENDDIDLMPRECVLWVHKASGKLLGWTYLHRVSPGGIRPIFKSDFIKFPDRTTGVGVGEFVGPQNRAADAVYNLRMDSGVLASTPMGVYRASSGLKPDTIRMQPGTMYPVDDPQNDVRIFNFPFLTGFGSQEEDRINSYIERGLSISDLQLGRTPSRGGGAFRTASGANQLEAASGIQLEIHFDRLARPLKRVLSALFRLCRERMPAKVFFRITGEAGQPIFGEVDREALKGDYDFEINVDVLGQTRLEQQQMAVMAMQTLMNPALMQTGVVTPNNLYELTKNFMIKHRFRGIDAFITKPQGYVGPVISPEQRVMTIVVGNFNDPPIEQTVQLNEDHARSLRVYDAFKKSDAYGYLRTGQQLHALEALIETTQRMQAAQQSGGNPNMSGMQVPRPGVDSPGMPAQQPGQNAGGQPVDPNGTPVGEVNGPVV